MITLKEVNEAQTKEELKDTAISAAEDFGYKLTGSNPIAGIAMLAAMTMNIHLLRLSAEIAEKWNREFEEPIERPLKSVV